MIDGNTVIVDRSPQAADPRLENTSNSRSPDIQEINEDIRQTHKIYQFQNCGTVYMDSFNTRGVRMENCGNNVPQVTYHRPRIIGNEKVPHSQSHAVTNGPQNATGPPTAPTSLAALDARTSRTKPRESEFPTCSDIGNDCFYSSNRSPPLPNSSFAVPHTGRILHVHISLSVDYVTFFSWVGLAAVFCLVLFCLGFSKGYS